MDNKRMIETLQVVHRIMLKIVKESDVESCHDLAVIAGWQVQNTLDEMEKS